ncbi:glycosyltransferase [Candidatus Woesearchaeota archaeon]|nr:glycosyltransferase [Candidatus Woesearchaeota archaeon]
MNNNLLFSVIMPNYNNAEYIKEAIESVLGQSYKNWELIIVDDASTDSSLKVIKSFLKNKKIKLIRNKKNKGVAYSAKKAVENSSGEIIGTLDSDDVLHEDALRIMVKAHLDNPKYGLIYSSFYDYDERLKKIIKIRKGIQNISKEVTVADLFFDKDVDNVPSIHFRTFKKSAYDKTEGYDETLRACEDWDIYSKLEKVTNIKGIKRYIYYRRMHGKIGAYQNNFKWGYYRLLYFYKELNRRTGQTLPCSNTKKFSPFLMNIRYFYFKKYSNISKEEFKNFFLSLAYYNRKKNILKAFFYGLNSILYGYNPLKSKTIKKLFSRILQK